jgi:hypothetical protein
MQQASCAVGRLRLGLPTDHSRLRCPSPSLSAWQALLGVRGGAAGQCLKHGLRAGAGHTLASRRANLHHELPCYRRSVTSCIAVAGSAQRAELLIKEKLPAYFHAGLVIASIDQDADDDALRMLEWIPLPVKTTLAEIPRGTGEYYSELHYNLS